MAEDDFVFYVLYIVVSAVEDNYVRLQIRVVLQRKFERICALVIKTQIEHINWRLVRDIRALR